MGAFIRATRSTHRFGRLCVSRAGTAAVNRRWGLGGPLDLNFDFRGMGTFLLATRSNLRCERLCVITRWNGSYQQMVGSQGPALPYPCLLPLPLLPCPYTAMTFGVGWAIFFDVVDDFFIYYWRYAILLLGLIALVGHRGWLRGALLLSDGLCYGLLLGGVRRGQRWRGRAACVPLALTC